MAEVVGRVGSSSRTICTGGGRPPHLVAGVLLANLIAHAPQYDGRVIAVAAQHGAQVGLVPVGEDEVEVERRLLELPGSKISSMTSRPKRSVSSSSSGAGGLWDRRMALTPTPCSNSADARPREG